MQGQVIQQRNEVTAQQIEKAVLMEAMANSDMGVSFLQWLCALCGWNRPMMSNEEAARRDIWLAIRRHVPVEKLSLIEFEELRHEQQVVKELLRTEAEQQATDEQ